MKAHVCYSVFSLELGCHRQALWHVHTHIDMIASHRRRNMNRYTAQLFNFSISGCKPHSREKETMHISYIYTTHRKMCDKLKENQQHWGTWYDDVWPRRATGPVPRRCSAGFRSGDCEGHDSHRYHTHQTIHWPLVSCREASAFTVFLLHLLSISLAYRNI